MMLPTRVAIAIRLHATLAPGERVVVAVSGGPDSLALLSLLREILPVIPLHLAVAHFDHGWRSDSGDDAAFVQSMAAKWGFEFHAGHAPADLPHTEGAARDARYAFLRQIAASTNGSVIAMGHTQDDQVETLLLHLLRGSGSRGLAAMRRRDRDLARPLLDITRAEIEAYLTRLHLTPRRDPSNDDPRFTRNRLRQQLLPAIDAFDPSARELLARTADILSEEDRYLDQQIAGLPDDLPNDRDAFATLPPALQRRIIRRLVPEANFLEIEARRRAQPAEPPSRAKPARPHVQPRLVTRTCTCDPSRFQARDSIGHLDADRIAPPLRLATRRPGDRMQPLGMAETKRLQDILVDAHVPRQTRNSLPIVEDAEEIVWIPGVTVSERKRVTSKTARQLHLEIDRG